MSVGSGVTCGAPSIVCRERARDIYNSMYVLYVASILRFVRSARVTHAASTCYDCHNIYCDVAYQDIGGSIIGVLEGFAPMYIAAAVGIASLRRLLTVLPYEDVFFAVIRYVTNT